MQIITSAIVKGGAGKTTTAAALAQTAYFYTHGPSKRRILAIDLDPQGNLTSFLGADIRKKGAFNLLAMGTPAAQLVQETAQGLRVISASPDLATIRPGRGSGQRLKMALAPIEADYDFIFIDTPPQIGELTYNALLASSDLVIPMEADTSNLQGLYQIADLAAALQQTNTRLRIRGALLTRYDGRPRINRHIRDMIKQACSDRGIPYLGEIRQAIALREAQALHESIYDYDLNSNATADYGAIFRKIKDKPAEAPGK